MSKHTYSDLPKNHTQGRCLDCQRLYSWQSGPGARLSRAVCPRCLEPLTQTCAPNIKRFSVRLILEDRGDFPRVPDHARRPYFRQEA